MHPFYAFMGGIAIPVARGPYRLRVRNFQDVPSSGGFVLASNHWSNIDPWILSMPFFPRRSLRYLAKAELFTPFLTPLLNAAGAFPIRRGEGDVEAYKTAVRLVQSGEIVLVFPQGHRQPPGEMERRESEIHAGAARIALAAGAPVVPAAIKGTDRLKRLGPLRVAYGSADTMEDLRSLPKREASRIATERVMERIYALYETL
jgi:1-acyl-sn-glycerol-3-phosphate acyltransferase